MFLFIVAPEPPCTDKNCTKSFGKYPNRYRSNGTIIAETSTGNCTFTKDFKNIRCVSCSNGSYEDGLSCTSKYCTKMRRQIGKKLLI